MAKRYCPSCQSVLTLSGDDSETICGCCGGTWLPTMAAAAFDTLNFDVVTGEVVAESWEDLTDGSLVNGIDRTLSGEKFYEHAAWTSTVPDGTAWDDSLDCDNWSSSAFEENARQGVTGYTDSRWSDDTFLTDCGSGGLLYCSEQE